MRNSKSHKAYKKQQNDKSSSLPVITANVNGLKSPMKRQKMANGFKNTIQKICSLQETHLDIKAQIG